MKTSRIEKGWKKEEDHLRKENACIFPPNKQKYYRIRRAPVKRGRMLEKGECNMIDRKEAFEAGNRLVRRMKKEEHQAWLQLLFNRKRI